MSKKETNKDMENHLELNDREFISKLEDCTLPSHLFSHEAHLRLAWLDLKKYGPQKAPEVICDQILKYVSHLNAQDKFNRTLTIAATRAVNHFMEKSDDNNFVDFINNFQRLKTNFKGLMASHYSFDIYNSKLAKTKYLEPDLLSF